MLRVTFLAIAALSIAATPTLAAPCKDAKGKFIKCPAAAATASASVVKGKDGRCRVASGPKKGQFAKCP